MMVDKTDNFKTKDKATLEKIDASLDKIISALQEKNPDALKSTATKTTGKTTATKSGKTAMQLAKEIRKPNESWIDARKRASEMMKNQKTKVSAKVDTEIKKLLAVVKKRKELQGFGKSDIQRDAVRKAKPKGKRVVTKEGTTSNQYGTFENKLGRKYYENRDNHSDRLAPKYPKNFPLLATGGSVTNERKHVNKSEDYEVRYALPRPNRKGYMDKRNFSDGGVMMQNQQVIDNASQSYVNYYLGEGASAGIYAEGGSINKNIDLSGWDYLQFFTDLNKAKQFVDDYRKVFVNTDAIIVTDKDNDLLNYELF
jgi:hypothetical protein